MWLLGHVPVSGQPTVDLLGTHSRSWGASAPSEPVTWQTAAPQRTAAAFLGSKKRFNAKVLANF